MKNLFIFLALCGTGITLAGEAAADSPERDASVAKQNLSPNPDDAGTNTLFLPEPLGVIGYQSPEENRILNEQSLAEALNSGECRPAEHDSGGHWGEVTCGFQMSLRSATNVFLSGTNQPVSVILRNTTTNGLLRATDYDDAETVFWVQDEEGHIKKSQPAGSRLSFTDLAPKRQAKFRYDLNRLLHLAPGIYQVHAEQVILSPGSTTGHWKPGGTVTSGIMTIKIISP